MDQIVQHITRRVDSFKADQDFQLELLKADLVAYVESKCASLVASSSSASTGSIPQPPTPLPQPANLVPRSIDSLAQQPTALVQQPSDHNTTTPSQSSTLSVNEKHSDPRTVPNCTVAQSTNASSIPLVITNPVRELSTAPSSSSEVVVASTSNLPEQSQQQQQQQSNVIREGGVKMEIKEEDADDENICRCDDLVHNLAPNGPASTSKALSNGASTSASFHRSSKSGCTRKRALSVNKHHHHRSNKKPALTAQVDDEEDDDESDDDNHGTNDDDSDYEEEEGDENDEEESDDEVDNARVDEDESGDEEDGEEEENQQQDRPAAQVITRSLRCPQSNCPETKLASVRQLTAHMRTAHSILAYACAARGCSQSFSNSRTLGDHLVHSHQSISKWHCSQCSHHFSTYKQLTRHKLYLHQLGHFSCAFRGCTFRGQYKGKVVTHYVQQHKRTFKCGQSGCQYETPSAANLKQHQRTHSGIKPYRCTWPECRYASTQQCHVIGHIRRHF